MFGVTLESQTLSIIFLVAKEALEERQLFRDVLPVFSSPLQYKGDREHQRTSGLTVICL